MNRYSLLFAAIVAASFVAPSPRPSDASKSHQTTAKAGAKHPAASADAYRVDAKAQLSEDANGAIDSFLTKQTLPDGAANEPDVLFATVPHPTETHLGADFDADVAAIEDGIHDSGYLFDSAWIPWESARPYDRLDDDLAEKKMVDAEDGFPGILVFRNPGVGNPGSDIYRDGLIVFLIAETPTGGMEVAQLDQAKEILKHFSIPLKQPIRLAGPNYSGSLNSLASAIQRLKPADSDGSFLIRAGVSSANESNDEIQKIAARWPGTRIDFGSTSLDFKLWKNLALTKLTTMGMRVEDIAFVSEDESLYGSLAKISQKECKVEDEKSCRPSWQIPFPRDISSLRTGYEQQGLFANNSPVEPWKRFLNLNTGEDGNGDTVKSLGGSATTANLESVLFGISGFLKAHNIRAVVISATNPEDEYFLSEFFHANNSGVRVVIIGGARLFTRGSTAQFRGDLVVDDFPMLPRLHDWNAGSPGDQDAGTANRAYTQHTFPTGFTEGIYVAVLDLMTQKPANKEILPWVSEYSTPNFDPSTHNQARRPEMYLTALGSDGEWPVSIGNESPFQAGNTDPNFVEKAPSKASTWHSWRVTLPMTLFERFPSSLPDPQPVGSLTVSHFWITLFLLVCALVISYCVCFQYANPLTRRLCASFQPAQTWRYWLFTVTFPAILAGCAFQVLAAPLAIQRQISEGMNYWYATAVGVSILAPLCIALQAWIKSNKSRDSQGYAGRWVALLVPAPLMILFACTGLWNFCAQTPLSVNGSILNAYREMHWESGLSLIPTWLLILLAVFVWTKAAGQSAALLYIAPVLPDFKKDHRISNEIAKCIYKIASPFPDYQAAQWLWWSWLTGLTVMFLTVRYLPAFRAVTTLENQAVTSCLLYAFMVVASLMLLDIFQFLWIWNELRKLLRALDSRIFKRSFVPIQDFKWAGLWSGSGISFYDQRVLLSTIVDCIVELDTANKAPFRNNISQKAIDLEQLRVSYRSAQVRPDIPQFRAQLNMIYRVVASISSEIATQIEIGPYPEPQDVRTYEQGLRHSAMCCEDKSPYKKEGSEVGRLEDWQQQSERLLCLNYIAFLQTAISRLHSLMYSIAGVFSLMALAIAVYPFAPISPFFLCGLALLPLIAWAFFHVFSQMDQDPILSRITNSDDRKLQWNFYGKFAESMALPVLTLVSSLLPGGIGRVLDMAQTLMSHSQ